MDGVKCSTDSLIDKYYSDSPALKDILVLHSRAVARKALECAARHPELKLDLPFVEEAAMLHDIGIFLTYAPSILCQGKLPYIAHGIAGQLILETEGLPDHARVCARHTGRGLTAEDIRRQKMPLPDRDFLPESLEEKLICYADKFFSKSGDAANLEREKPLEKVRGQMAAFGPASLSRFDELHRLFG